MGCCRNFWRDFGGNAFEQPLSFVLSGPGIEHARRMLTGRAEPDPEVPCSSCELYLDMARTERWIRDSELQSAAPKPLITLGVPVIAGESPATHVDVFVAPGPVNRLLLAAPPKALRYRIGDPQTTAFTVQPGGEYTVYALPKRMDPEFRRHYPPLAPVTKTIVVERRPIVQETLIEL
jgi:hypothetical protein